MSDIIACEALNCRVTEDEWDLLNVPAAAIRMARVSIDTGVTAQIAYHPKHGWVVVGETSDGPRVLWRDPHPPQDTKALRQTSMGEMYRRAYGGDPTMGSKLSLGTQVEVARCSICMEKAMAGLTPPPPFSTDEIVVVTTPRTMVDYMMSFVQAPTCRACGATMTPSGGDTGWECHDPACEASGVVVDGSEFNVYPTRER